MHGGLTIPLSPRKAAADLSDNQYYAVRLDETSGEVKLGNATSASAGILQNKPETNAAAGIVVFGETPAVCTGTFAYMDTLAADDNGQLAATTTDQDKFIAFALGAHTADGASTIERVFVVGFGGSERSTS